MSGVGPHLSDEVLGIQPGSLQATQHPRNSFVRLPNCRIITRLTGNDSPGRIKWTALTWPAGELLPSHLTILSEFCVDQSCVILAIWHFLRATSCSNNTAELSGFAEARSCRCFFHPSRRNGYVFVQIRSTRLVLPLVLITPEETLL